MARKSYPTLSEIYRRAWESCLALWPLFIVRFVFVVVNFGAIFLCLFLVCWPFIQTLWKVFKDSEGGNFANVLKEADFSSFTPDAHWIFYGGGHVPSFHHLVEPLGSPLRWRGLRPASGPTGKREYFFISRVFQGRPKVYGPHDRPSDVLFLILMGLLLAGGLFTVLIVVFFKALSISPWFGLLLAVPGGFASFALLLWLAGFAVMGGAYLMEDEGVLSALQKAFHKCLEGYARVVLGLLPGLGHLFCVFRRLSNRDGHFGAYPPAGGFIHPLRVSGQPGPLHCDLGIHAGPGRGIFFGKGIVTVEPSSRLRGLSWKPRNYAEADKIIQLYTLSLGRIKAIAKGVRKPKSKLSSAIDLFTESSFSLHKRPSADLYLMTQAKVIDSHSDLKKDLKTITALQVLADLVSQSLHESEPHPEVYSLLKETLAGLGIAGSEPEALLVSFILKFLGPVG